MAGIVGRSGRRSRVDEAKRTRIVEKAWAIAELYLDDPNIPMDKKIEVACKVIVKDMPNKLSDFDGGTLPQPIINVITSRKHTGNILPAEESTPSTPDAGVQV